MGEHWRIAGVYSADSVMTPVRVAIWEGHRRFLCAVPQEIAEQIMEAVNDRARLLGEVERLRRELMQWEEFDFERDNPKRLVEHTLALMIERDKAQALAASLSEELHRLGKDNQRLRAALALAATPAVTTGCAPRSAGERPIETEWPLTTCPRRTSAQYPEERMSDTEQAALDAAYLAWLADQTRLSSWAAAWQAGRDWARLEAADRQAALAAEVERLKAATARWQKDQG